MGHWLSWALEMVLGGCHKYAVKAGSNVNSNHPEITHLDKVVENPSSAGHGHLNLWYVGGNFLQHVQTLLNNANCTLDNNTQLRVTQIKQLACILWSSTNSPQLFVFVQAQAGITPSPRSEITMKFEYNTS